MLISIVVIWVIISFTIAGYTINQCNKVEKEFKETIRKAAITELEKRFKQNR